MDPRLRSALLWVPYVVVAVVHVIALVVDRGSAGPTKLLLMPLLTLPVIGACAVVDRRVTTLLFAALASSWVGDSAGELVSGGGELPLMLAFFAAAHIAYIVLFTRRIAVRSLPRWTVVYGIWWIAMVAAVGPHAGALVVAVAAYGLVLAGTAATAGRCAPLVAVGGACFLTSDSLLAFRLFLPDAAPGWFGPAVMATYTVGQGLIVAGTLRAAGSAPIRERTDDSQRAAS
ncbi:lysoplasmalogenase [Gordonia neofelifaecis]|uniref:YhhN family protein n=1 Tax=Gordonia neofelifaecis NRRL B-59395 TaxID=644548 RepID=F1YNL7_9ACTN|nr:lysoplasmalogenase [Gordonia neofelifaecis]EGD53754.1 hypothetical protein SCNU_17495 [Gordonia neofelifaecis NRRL B-59395]